MLYAAEALESRVMLSRVIYVDDSAPGGGDGTSWNLAYQNLQVAFQSAVGGDEIRVGQGTYRPTTGTDRDASFLMKSGVAICGGYAGFGAGNPDVRNVRQHASVLSGDIGVRGNNTDNSYHVVTGNAVDATAVLDGLVVTGGNANSVTAPRHAGGGMYIGGGSPSVRNCVFVANFARSGAGIHAESSSAVVVNCTFSGNVAIDGGGMTNITSSTIVANCSFSGNWAADSSGTDGTGGGIYNWSSSSVVTNCIVWGNYAVRGEQIDNFGGSPVVAYCNTSGGRQSGTGNISIDPQFVRNPSYGADAKWGTADDDLGDLRLRLTSPCIDAGNNATVPAGIITDLAGNPRFDDVPSRPNSGNGIPPLVDMGAYEPKAAIQALAGGPYRALEGTSVILSGTGYSPQGLAVSYAWDLDGDGEFDDASIASPTFSAIGLAARSIVRMALRVTDLSGAVEIDTTSVFVVPSVVYVDDSATGLDDGSGWPDAYSSLQSAIAQSLPGQVIRVAKGVYKPDVFTDRTATFWLRGLNLYGGYAGVGAGDPNERNTASNSTVLSGDLGTIGNVSDNSYHVVTASGKTLLEGFVVTAGNANGGTSYLNSGGGMYSGYDAGGSPIIRGCIFRENRAQARGGGMSIDGSAPTLEQCVFAVNVAGDTGGAIYNAYGAPTVSLCTFNGNLASTGGGISIYSSSPSFIQCTFSGNLASSNGGAMFNSQASPVVKSCAFSGNSAGSGGGAIYNSSSSPNVTNSILWANGAPTGSQILTSGGTPVITYCDVQGGYAGSGNTNIDPQFVRNPGPGADARWGDSDDDFGDLRLRLISPCIDAGNSAAVSAGVTIDLAGNPRFSEIPLAPDTGSGPAPVVDMGPYEAQPQAQALAGGPYRVVERESVQLSGAGYALDGAAVSYAWDLDGDGEFDDASVASPVYLAGAGPMIRTITLRVTDASGAMGTDSTTLEVIRPIYVDDTAIGLNDGSSWRDAFASLQSALAQSLSGDVIRVARGTYKPTDGTDRTISFALRGGVSLQGGFSGFGTANPDARDIVQFASVLSGDVGVIGSNADNSYHVVVGNGVDGASVLDGFTIVLGNANVSDSNNDHCGGGLYNQASSPTVRNCTFRDNRAQAGGAIYNALSSSSVTTCTFLSNWSTVGGGVYIYSGAVTLAGCVFDNNSGGNGAAIYNDSSSPTITQCTLVANRASGYGGALYSSAYPKVTNCILWANSAAMGNQIYVSSGTPSVTYSNVQGGYTGTGNINVDPQFIRNPGAGVDFKWGTSDDDYGDPRLRLISPCIDAGNNAAVPTWVMTDLAGASRFADVPARADTGNGAPPLVDIGAFETRPVLQAVAGGPYRVLERDTVILSGAGYSPMNLPMAYAWDLDGDGNFGDAFGASAVFDATGLSGPLTLSIALRVTDSLGATACDTTTIEIVRPIYVDDSAPGLNDGTSWFNAFTHLQSALAIAAPGQVMRVAWGVYRPTDGTDRTVSFVLPDRVSMLGGFAGFGESSPDTRDPMVWASTLSGDLGVAGVTSDNSYHVITSSGRDVNCVMDGFTITAGNANGSSAQNCGGGLYNSGSSPVIRNCTFIANVALSGGAMYNVASSVPSIIGCTFNGNTATNGGAVYNKSSKSSIAGCMFSGNHAQNGGGIYNSGATVSVTDCTFSRNTALTGAGMYSSGASTPTVTRCTFNENSLTSNGGGGGMYCSTAANAIVTDCVFSSNSAGYGGGLACASASPVVTNCTFTRNLADKGGGIHNGSSAKPTLTNVLLIGNRGKSEGGGMLNDSSTPTLTNCVFVGNAATGSNGRGGAMSNLSSSPSITNCTLVANASTGEDGAAFNLSSSPIFTNCILWANSSAIVNSPNSIPVITWCDIQGGYAGVGNIDADPQFIRNPFIGADSIWGTADDDYGDLRLKPTSPCIDAGSNAALPADTADLDNDGGTAEPLPLDLDGHPRRIDFAGKVDTGSGTAPVVDMGAYERLNHAPTITSLNVPGLGVCYQPLAMTAALADPDLPVDWHVVAWNFGDGTTIASHSTADPGALAPTHAYTTNGIYKVTCTITDAAGLVATMSRYVGITNVTVLNNTLLVGGTSGNNYVHVSNASAGKTNLFLASAKLFGVYSVAKAVIYGGPGDDLLEAAWDYNRSVEIWGGDGRDLMRGGLGDDALFGENGNDRLDAREGTDILVGGDGADDLRGGNGRDIAIGGRGADWVYGDGGEDLLVAGFTSFDADATALSKLRDEWAAARPLDQRAANLRDGTGSIDRKNGDLLLIPGTTVFNDSDSDWLWGGGGTDWCFANPAGDKLADRAAGENTALLS